MLYSYLLWELVHIYVSQELSATQISGSGKEETFKSIEIYVVAAFIGAGGAGMLITSLSITAELIGKNKTSSAFVYSSISLVDKIINGK